MSRGETVLLVEDDTSILKLGTRMLEKLGYTVLSAATPAEAADQAQRNSGDIELLITDVIMSEMNGRQLSEKLRTIHPELKILYMSGYTADVIAHRGVLEEGGSFVQKPFSKREMAIKVRAVLDGTSG